jgi:ATP-dependent Clp protease ATP-binding subunit ClpA
MFERFSREARVVVRMAQEEARRSHHPSVGAEHLLIAMLGGGQGPAGARVAGPRAADRGPARPGRRDVRR